MLYNAGTTVRGRRAPKYQCEVSNGYKEIADNCHPIRPIRFSHVLLHRMGQCQRRLGIAGQRASRRWCQPRRGHRFLGCRHRCSLLPHRLGSNGRCDATLAEGRDWLDAFAFSDVPNWGQTAHTVTRLTPCLRYAFIAASLNRRFGDARWSEWTFLTPAGDGNVSCPAATPTGTPAPTATPTPWPPPTGTGDYDADQDGLIEVSNLAQLNAIGADLDGDGLSPSRFYTSAFPGAQAGMGCPYVCARYELVADLNLTPTATAPPTRAMFIGTVVRSGFPLEMKLTHTLPPLRATAIRLPICTSTAATVIMSVYSDTPATAAVSIGLVWYPLRCPASTVLAAWSGMAMAAQSPPVMQRAVYTAIVMMLAA